jgi:hypothetical protein
MQRSAIRHFAVAIEVWTWMALLSAMLLVASPHMAGAAGVVASTCVGDCDGSGDVTVDEIVTLVNMALGNQTQLSACPHGLPADVTDASQVDVAVIITAVNNALSGCRAIPPTALPTATRTPAQTPTPSHPPSPTATITFQPGACAYGFSTDTSNLPSSSACVYGGVFNTSCPTKAAAAVSYGNGAVLAVGIVFNDPLAPNVIIGGTVNGATNASIVAWATTDAPTVLFPLSGTMTLTNNPTLGQVLSVLPTSVPFSRLGCPFDGFVGAYLGTAGSLGASATRSMQEQQPGEMDTALRAFLGALPQAGD